LLSNIQPEEEKTPLYDFILNNSHEAAVMSQAGGDRKNPTDRSGIDREGMPGLVPLFFLREYEMIIGLRKRAL